MIVSITYERNWRAPWWDADIPAREAWFVSCSFHPELGKTKAGQPWGYAEEGSARAVRTRHLRAKHGHG